MRCYVKMNRNQYNRLNTIESIKESFMKLYKKKGIDGVTISSICEDCQISRTIFYQYFDDKYDVLQSIEEMILTAGPEICKRHINTDISGHKPGTPFPMVYEIFCYAKEKEIFFKPLIGPHGDSYFIFKWKQAIQSDLRQKLEHDGVLPDDFEVASAFLASGLIGLVIYYHKN